MGFWAATAKSNTSNMKINRSPPIVSWSGEVVLPAADLRAISDEYTASTKGCGRSKRGGKKSCAGHGEKTDICKSPVIVCVRRMLGIRAPVISTP